MTDNWNTYWANESNRHYWLKPDDAIVDLLAKMDWSKIKAVLDIGCGAGRHALLFAKAGFDVTAVDSSTEVLSVLQEQVRERGIRMKLVHGNYADDLFPPASFDFVLAYNVLYHGHKTDFQQAVCLIHRWLKPGGLFFFTCPTRRDGKFGNGDQVSPHAFKSLNSIHPGDIHYFSDEKDIMDLLQDFRQVSKEVNEHYWDNNGIRQFSSYWQILARKRNSPVT